MSQLIRYVVLFLVVYSEIAGTLKVVSIPGNEVCPLKEQREAAIQNIRATVEKNLMISHNCGNAGEWYRVAHLNMSDSSRSIRTMSMELV